MQSPVVTDRVLAQKDGRVQLLVETYKNDPARVVDELFLGTLNRPPTGEEKDIAMQAVSQNLKDGAENLQWALINHVEFLFNH